MTQLPRYGKKNNMLIEVHPIDGNKCKQVIDDMIKTPTERKTQSVKDKLRRFVLTLPLTNKKELNIEQLNEPTKANCA